MKIILEFTHEEAKQAEQSYRGPDYAMAVEEFRAHLRNKIKYGELPEPVQKELESLYEDFHNIFEGLLND